MALANVAYLAAANGHRVLVMDWDLEAPGLHYYFRGLLEPSEAHALKQSPGVLNMIWDWENAISNAKDSSQVKAAIKRNSSDEFFRQHVRNITSNQYGFDSGVIDFINAGSATIDTPESSPYEDALSKINWANFFDKNLGGKLIESLKKWSKKNYDFILIDSRTGLADVSGICTMQIPDSVALCFILNRQNIDGVAKISATIRKKRNEEIKLFAAPMRLAASDTGAEADARARSLHELTKVGGFSNEEIQEDFKYLSVRSSGNLPYYEAISPIVAIDIQTDPLLHNYLRFANRILGVSLAMPDLDPEWVETVRRRLHPKHATIEYVTRLQGADPLRTIHEIDALLESALSAVIDGEPLDEEYISALLDTAFLAVDGADIPFEVSATLDRSLELVRNLHVQNVEKWRDYLVFTIERYLDAIGYTLVDEEELALLDELDDLLASVATLASRLKQIGYRRRAARITVRGEDIEAANQTIGEMLTLIKQTKDPKLAADQHEQIISAEIDAHLLKGEIHEIQKDDDKSYQEYNAGLNKILTLDRGSIKGDIGRLAADIYSKLAKHKFISAIDGAHYAVEAAKYYSISSSIVFQFVELAKIILRAPNNTTLLMEFCENVLQMQERSNSLTLAHYYGRIPRTALDFIKTSDEIARVLIGSRSRAADQSVSVLVETVQRVWRNIIRRRHTIGESLRASLHECMVDLARTISKSEIHIGEARSIISDLDELQVKRPRP
jgi:hypothetical protein